ncbi:MAG: tRNA dihydrouridine synthase DusB [Lachnospiraceae bacterium]|nr:tRNA dihydrouridine synthase DusB [Lachnospiraceae bacterium]
MELHIGNVRLENNIILGPMAGVCDLPFRLLCKEQGAGLVCMEMVSAKALMYNNRNTQELLTIDERERPVSLQLFGSDPEIMGTQAARLEERPFDILDLNMGCPVPKVVNNGEGSALMKNPKLAAEIAGACVRAINKPVTVKIRKGFNGDHLTAVELSKRLEDVGVSAITVHGRTRDQFYSGEADWDVIRRVKEAVGIPVIGSGDVTDGPTAKKMLDTTGVDGVMIARAARGNPWIFREVLHFLETGEEMERPSLEEKKETILRHSRMLCDFKGEYIAIREMRKHVAWYTAGMPGSAAFRGRINEMESLSQLEGMIEEFVNP